MTTCLYNILPLTAGADRMSVTDPHGWTLTLISVSVVFTALIVLYFIYSLSGKAFSMKRDGESARKVSRHGADERTAAAIALALELENGGEVQAAIALALELEQSNSVHDIESGIITVQHHSTQWDDKTFNFRKAPSNGKL